MSASSTRYFVLLGDRTAEEAMDRAERHGPVVGACFHPSPAGEAVYGWVEVAAPTPAPNSGSAG
jgi:hypothetical protein